MKHRIWVMIYKSLDGIKVIPVKQEDKPYRTQIESSFPDYKNTVFDHLDVQGPFEIDFEESSASDGIKG